MTMTEIAEMIEDGTRALVEEDAGIEACEKAGKERWRAAGIGFPTGLNVNEVAAHYSPNAGDKQGESACGFLSSKLHC
jgi:methionyl aminopeptidase